MSILSQISFLLKFGSCPPGQRGRPLSPAGAKRAHQEGIETCQKKTRDGRTVEYRTSKGRKAWRAARQKRGEARRKAGKINRRQKAQHVGGKRVALVGMSKRLGLFDQELMRKIRSGEIKYFKQLIKMKMSKIKRRQKKTSKSKEFKLSLEARENKNNYYGWKKAYREYGANANDFGISKEQSLSIKALSYAPKVSSAAEQVRDQFIYHDLPKFIAGTSGMVEDHLSTLKWSKNKTSETIPGTKNISGEILTEYATDYIEEMNSAKLLGLDNIGDDFSRYVQGKRDAQILKKAKNSIQRTIDRDFRNRNVSIPNLYEVSKKNIPGLTISQLKESLVNLSYDEGIDLNPVNELSEMEYPRFSIHYGMGELYYVSSRKR